MARFLINRKKSHGKAPGSLIFIGNKKMEKSLIRIIQYNKDTINESELEKIENITDYLKKDSITWINIDGLQDIELIEKTGQIFNLSLLTLEDILNTDQRPKLTEDGNNIVIILKALYYKDNNNTLDSEQISFILNENCLITIQERVGDHFDKVRERLRNSIGRLRQSGSDYLCYSLLDAIVDNYIINIEVLGDEIEKQEKLILSAKKKVVEDIFRYKTELAYIRKAIRPVKEIMTHLLKSELKLISKKISAYLSDLDDLVIQSLEAVEIYYTMISDQLNVYNANVSNRVNDVMKVLTVFSTIFIPLTFITGVYGMNFDNLPELHFKYGYFFVWGVMSVVAIGMLIYFKNKKWW